MDCVVTGGAGFIGSNLVDALLARGDRVTVIDNLSSGKRANLERALARGATLNVADVSDGAAIAEIFEPSDPRSCSTMRPRSTCATPSSTPADDATINVLGTITVLEAARQAGTRRFVFASTGGGLYGDADVLPDAGGPPDQIAGPVRPGQATRPRATASCTSGCTASRPCRCGTATSTARARTFTARPASWRSSAGT